MLTFREATDEYDRRIAIGLSKWTGQPLCVRTYTRSLEAAGELRARMELEGRSGRIRPVTLDERPAFFYSCQGTRGEPFSQGVGDTPALAICDAFLHCCPDPL
jgi:hypothetical protein